MGCFNWVARELHGIELGDQRRTRRTIQTVERMARRPQGSVLQFSKNWAGAKGTYRLLSPRAARARRYDLAAATRAALAEACVKRMVHEDLVLAIQDTTCFDFHTHPATTGLGPVGGGRDGQGGQGFFVHTTLAVSATGVPLGLLDQQTWTRGPQLLGQGGRRHKVPLEQRESYRWTETQAAINERLPAETTVITVADREADIFEFLAAERPAHAHVLIRANGARLFAEGEGLVRDAIRHAPVLGAYDVTVRPHPQQRARDVRLTVQAMTVTLPPPHTGRRFSRAEATTLSALWVTEQAPASGDGIQWLLFTDLPVPDLATAQRYVYYYTLRWLIERYHFTLKSGCRIEASQLRTGEALENLLALYCLVAWRLLWLTYAARQDEPQPCTAAFSDLEWRTLQRLYQADAPVPAEPPPLRTVTRWLGRLGGHLGRKGDGEPGVKVLWIGLTRLADIITGVELFD
jgi:hypothetical protein